jgi:SAM-dependent methyltransferase
MTHVDPDAVVQAERAAWTRAAPIYAENTAKLTSQAVRLLLDAAHLTSESRALEVGCGPGHVTAMMAETGATVTGVDLVPAMVETTLPLPRRAPAQASFLPGLPTLPGSGEERGATAAVAASPHPSVLVRAAWPRSSRWGVELSHHSPDRLMADAEVSGQLAEGVIGSQSEDGRSLRRRESTRPRLLIGRTGRSTDLTPRRRLGDDNSAAR